MESTSNIYKTKKKETKCEENTDFYDEKSGACKVTRQVDLLSRETESN